jgi:[citrate (pro-3S)-lyase] ligase
LIQEQARQGRMHYFIYTLASKGHIFAGLGFTEIARAEPYAALLEMGLGSIETYCKAAAKIASHLPPQRAAVVIKCDPFTKGNQVLIQKAARENAGVIVFVVSEEKSLFPFDRTMELVKVGVADLANVVVISSGPYIVTSTTFPSYFTSRGNRVTAQTRLDCSLFASQIAPGLGITTRYVIEEPCPATNAYHEAMKEIFPKHRIDLRVMSRTQADGEIISASKVRDMIRHGDWEGITEAVPEATYRYLVSPEARNILDEIIHSSPRH